MKGIRLDPADIHLASKSVSFRSFPLNPIENLGPMDDDFLWSLDRQLDLSSADFHHRDSDCITDRDGFAQLPC